MNRYRRSNFYLILIFTSAASLVFLMMWLTYRHLDKLSVDTSQVYHSQNVSISLVTLYANLREIETERRNYILDNDFKESKSTINNKITENKIILDKLRKLLIADKEQEDKLKILEEQISKKYEVVSNTFSKHLKETNNPMEVRVSLLEGRTIMEQIKNSVDEMVKIEERLLKERRSVFLSSEKFTPVYLYIISILSLALLGVAFSQTYRDLRKKERDNAKLKFAIETANLAEKIGDYGVWTYDPDRAILNFSENEKKILGADMKSPADLHLIEHKFDKKDIELFNENINNTLAGQDSHPFITKLREDGQPTKFLHNTTERIQTYDGAILLGITRDITKEIENKTDLENAYEDLKFYYNSSKAAERIGNYGFWRWTKDGDISWFSDNFYSIFGLQVFGEQKIEEVLSVVHAKDQALAKEKFQEIFDGKNVEDFVVRVCRERDNMMRYISFIPRKMDWAKDLSYLVITKDITDEILDKKNLEDQNRVLISNNEELKAFNYVASHDLQEPLRKIETFISRLKDKDNDNLSESGKQYLDRARASAGRMRNLIDDLLQFSRSTRGDNNYEVCNLNILLDEAKEELQASIEAKNAVIHSNELPELEVIPFQIKQLFTNLIGNSIKYSKDYVAPEIKIKSEKVSAQNEPLIQHMAKGDFYRLEFSDNGIGFDNSYTEKIFQLFSRLHGKSEYEGTGIGLAICKKIIENHKGYIFAQGQEGLGAVFTFYLPVKIS